MGDSKECECDSPHTDSIVWEWVLFGLVDEESYGDDHVDSKENGIIEIYGDKWQWHKGVKADILLEFSLFFLFFILLHLNNNKLFRQNYSKFDNKINAINKKYLKLCWIFVCLIFCKIIK